MNHSSGANVTVEVAKAPPEPPAAPDSRIRFAPPRSPSRRYSVAAVDRALDILEALAGRGPASLADLSAAAGCTRTAGFRLLRTLEARGFAIQDGARGAWRLGARCNGLGAAARAQGALAAAARPVLAALGSECGETVYLRVREGLEAETVALFRPDQSLRLYAEVGQRRPLHAGSARLLLACAPDAIRRQVLSLRLPRLTPSTRTEIDWIAADLQRIRARGFLLTADEVEMGAVSISAPVWDATGQAVAALVIGAPALRLRLPRARALVPAVLKAAAALSSKLGDAPRPAGSDPAALIDPTALPQPAD